MCLCALVVADEVPHVVEHRCWRAVAPGRDPLRRWTPCRSCRRDAPRARRRASPWAPHAELVAPTPRPRAGRSGIVLRPRLAASQRGSTGVATRLLGGDPSLSFPRRGRRSPKALRELPRRGGKSAAAGTIAGSISSGAKGVRVAPLGGGHRAQLHEQDARRGHVDRPRRAGPAPLQRAEIGERPDVLLRPR